MPGWGLKLLSLATTLAIFIGSWGYAAAHVKNVKAPLQPPVPTVVASPSASPRPTPVPALVQDRPGLRRPSGSPGAAITLAPGVLTTALPAITVTHFS